MEPSRHGYRESCGNGGPLTDNNDGTWNWNWTPPVGTSPGNQTVTITATDTTTDPTMFDGFANLRSRFAGHHGHDPQHRIAGRGGHRLPADDLCNRRAVDPESATPTGKLDFFDGDKYLGIVSLYQSDQGQTSFTLSSGLSAGPHSITLRLYQQQGLVSAWPRGKSPHPRAPTVQTPAFLVSLNATSVELQVHGADVGESNLTIPGPPPRRPPGADDPTFSVNDCSTPTRPRPPSARRGPTPSRPRSPMPKGSPPRAR